MKNISQLQRNFANHIYKKSDKKIIAALPYSSQESLARLNIYRNNVFGSFNDVLESIFEVVKKIVGEKYFLQIAEEYHKKYHSKSGNLDYYGEEFPLFIKSIFKKHKLPYLYDLCRLELAYHQAYFSKNVAIFNVKKFQKISQENFFNLTFELHPSVFLFASKFPIFSIWKDNIKKFSKKKISLLNPEFAMVARSNGGLEIFKITQEEFIFLENIKQQKTLFEIYKKIIRATKKECDIGQILQRFIAIGVITNFNLKKESK